MQTLKEARAERLLSVRELAKQAGVASSTVHLAETGRSRPSFAAIRKISAALGVDPRAIAEFAGAIDAATGRGDENENGGG